MYCVVSLHDDMQNVRSGNQGRLLLVRHLPQGSVRGDEDRAVRATVRPLRGG